MGRKLLVFIPCLLALTLLVFAHFAMAGESQLSSKNKFSAESARRRTSRQQKSLADLAANDPFSGGAAGSSNKSLNGHQLTCTEAGVPCTPFCGFLDWWTENNRTIAVTAYQEFTANSPAECFAACQAAAPNCTAFTFNPTTRTCSIFSTFLYSKMVPGAGFSLYIRLGPQPPQIVLNEWIMTRDRRPYYSGFLTVDMSPNNPNYTDVNTSWATCLQLCSMYPLSDDDDTIFNSTLPTCLAATFDLTSKLCTLYNNYDSPVLVTPQIVAMTHISAYLNGPDSDSNRYRFNQFDHLTPAFDPNINVTSDVVDSVDDCLDACVDLGWNCTLAAISYSGDDDPSDDDEDYINCDLYQDIPVKFVGDTNSFNQSFFFNVQYQNSLMRKLPSFAQVQGQPLATFSAEGLNDCLNWALAVQHPNSTSSGWWYFTYNSGNSSCTLYSQNIDGILINPTIDPNLTQNSMTFSNSIPTYNVDYYSYDYFWADPDQVTFPQGSPFFTRIPSLDFCLAICINMTSSSNSSADCPGVIYRPKDGQCAVLNPVQMQAILTRDQNSSAVSPTFQSWQVFIKSRDLRFLQGPNGTIPKDIYTCMNTSIYDQQLSAVNRSNPLVGQQQLDQFEDGLVNNTAQWLEPHGPNFGGGPQPGLTQGQNQGQGQGAPSPPPPSTGSKFNNKNLDTAPTHVHRDKIPDVIVGGGLAGTAAGAAIGAVLGPLGAAAGAVAGNALGSVAGVIACLLGGCTDPAPNDISCEEACQLRSSTDWFLDTLREVAEISRRRYDAVSPKFRPSWSAVPTFEESLKLEDKRRWLNSTFHDGKSFRPQVTRANCKCKDTPYPINQRIGALKPPDFNSTTDYSQNNPELQKDCDGSDLKETCEICCAAGYESVKDPVCECVNAQGEWVPNPGKCTAEQKCILSQKTWSSGKGRTQLMQRIKVQSCRERFYYGVGFLPNRKIPLYTAHHFSDPQYKFTGEISGFSVYPCKEVKKNQLTNKWYIDQNKKLTGGQQYQRGHITPNADSLFFRDSAKATYYFINAAPQDSNSNNYWGKLEAAIRVLLNSTIPGPTPTSPKIPRGGHIITGTCYDDSPGAGPIPKCYWKLVCTVDDNNKRTAAGFYASNDLTGSDTAKKDLRRMQIYQVRNQEDLVGPPYNALGPIKIQDLWDEFKQYQPTFSQDFDECAKADKIQFPDVSFPPTTKQDDQFALFHFWNDNLFGPTFDKGDIPPPPTIPTSLSGSPPACPKKVVGYVTSWSNVRFTQDAASYLTHAIMAFVEMKPDGTLVLGSPDPTHSTNPNLDRDQAYARMYELRNAKMASGGRLKTLFAVGGWENSQYFSSVIANDGLIQNFGNSALDIIDYFDMDGIDIDFEYPVTGGATNGTAADRENYVKFLRTLRTMLTAHATAKGRKDSYLLTIAGAAGIWVLEPGFDLPSIIEQVDWINVMTYDYFGAWDSQWGAYTGPIAPLYYGAPPNYSGKLNVDFTMKDYLCNITDAGKLVMGLGFYGRFWNNSGSPVNGSNPLWRKATPNAAGKFDGGYLPYRHIASGYLNNGNFTKAFDQPTRTPFLYQSPSGGMLLAYEDPASISIKVAYAASKGFAGVMIWAVDLDDNSLTMLRTASSNALCGAAESQPYKCPPNVGQRWWTLEDNPATNAGMCGKSAPLYNGYYPVCDPEDPGYGCCSAAGYCGSGPNFCNCTGCVDYYSNPDLILQEPIKPAGPVRWLTMDKLVPGQPSCGYNATSRMPDGSFPICNPDNVNAYCCSGGSYCGVGADFCDCAECHDFKKDPNFVYPPKTWIDSGPDAGKCGKGAPLVNGKPATCNPLSPNFHCCSNSSFCGAGPEFCLCTGCVDFALPSSKLLTLDATNVYLKNELAFNFNVK